MDPQRDFLQLHLHAIASSVDALEDALLAAGALSVTLGDREDHPILEPGVGETPLWPEVRISALFTVDTDTSAVLQSLADTLGFAPQQPQWEHLADRAWEREWLQHFAPVRFGERLWVCPGGSVVEQADAIVLHLDPGLAFGTGTHPTTALCLEWIAAHGREYDAVIDYGCGSGILAVAALLMGARQVRAIDIDPQALLATRDNATRNAIAESRLTVGDPTELDETTSADLLLANILAGPLIELAPRFARLLRPGAPAVLSGILALQAEQVVSAYLPWFERVEVCARDEWVRIELRRSNRKADAQP